MPPHERPARAAGASLTAAFLGPVTSAARALVHGTDATVVTDLAAADVVHVTAAPAAVLDELVALLPTARTVVLHQRPDSLRPPDLRRLTEGAAAAPVVVAVPFVQRYYPMVRLARRRVRSGAPGPLHLLHGWSSPDGVAAWADLLEFISRHRIQRVCATSVDPTWLDSAEATPDTPGALGLVFETDRGAVGTLAVSHSRPVEGGTLLLVLDGVEESVAFHEGRPEVLDVMGARGTQRYHRGVGADVSRYSTQPAGLPQGHRDCWASFVADAHAAARGATPDGLPTLADLTRTASLRAAVRACLTTSGWVDVGPDAELELLTTTEGKTA